MPKYLVEGRYTSDGLKGLAREGSSQRRAPTSQERLKAQEEKWSRFISRLAMLTST